MIKLWHDDVRRPPDPTWVWARTNEQAREFLNTGLVAECSLDHDMGKDILGPEESGVRLVSWMVQRGCIPDRVTIHSQNPPGARRMADILNDAGYSCYLNPYRGF